MKRVDRKYMLAAFFDGGKETYKFDLRIIKGELYLMQEGGRLVKLQEVIA